ncbi:MAG: hypothetical protein V8R94_12080 [Lachnospiraceae bacterium]
MTLSGGSFDSIKIKNGADYQSLLAEGYAYQKQDGALVKLSEMNANTAVTVVKCSHPDDHSGGNVCPYCGYAAEVTKTDGSISYHRTAGAAIAAADGGTVKLLANAGEITIGSPLKLDLNGKTAAKLTVTGDVTLASLLPEGYAFKSGSTWISDPIGTELTNVSMAKIPIKSMDYPTEMSMTYGGTGTLLVKVAKETGTGAVRFQWYKVEDGNATAVGSATTKNQFDLSAQKLSAGRHTFRFSATCNGYEKISKDIVVTVEKARHRRKPHHASHSAGKSDLYRPGAGADYRGQRDQRRHHAVQPDRERHIQSEHPHRHQCRNVYRVVSGDWRCKPQRYRTRQRGSQHWEEAADDHRGNGCVQAL